MRESTLQDRIEPSSPNDFVEMSNVIVRCLREVNARDYPAQVIEELVFKHAPGKLEALLQGKYSIVLKRRGEVIATGALAGSEITTVFVLPSLQGRGFGQNIMEALEQEAIRQGLIMIHLHASLNAVRFYEKLGYQHLELIHREVGGKTYHMQKVLQP